MAESPPPVDSSLNAPNVGSPTTMMERLRLRDQTEENGKEDGLKKFLLRNSNVNN